MYCVLGYGSEIISVCLNSSAPQDLVTGWQRWLFEDAFIAETFKPGQQLLLVLPTMKPLRHGCDVKGSHKGCPDLLYETPDTAKLNFKCEGLVCHSTALCFFLDLVFRRNQIFFMSSGLSRHICKDQTLKII